MILKDKLDALKVVVECNKLSNKCKVVEAILHSIRAPYLEGGQLLKGRDMELLIKYSDTLAKAIKILTSEPNDVIAKIMSLKINYKGYKNTRYKKGKQNLS